MAVSVPVNSSNKVEKLVCALDAAPAGKLYADNGMPEPFAARYMMEVSMVTPLSLREW